MEPSWPGLVIGPVLFIACLIGFRKIGSVGKFAGRATETVVGRKTMDRLPGGQEFQKTAMVIPLLGGMALGLGITFFSLFPANG